MCGDVLPAACYGRAYRELDERGLTLRRHAAPLSPVERAREAEVQQRRAVEEQLRRERLRRDEALLASYGTVADLDAQRDRTLRLQQQALDDARARQRILKARQQELHARSPAAGPPQGGASPPGGQRGGLTTSVGAPPPAAGPPQGGASPPGGQRGGLTTSVGAHPPAAGRSAPPMEVQISLREIESELQTLETVVERKVAEIESTRSRFEAERKRFLELTVERRPEASPREPAAPTQQ